MSENKQQRVVLFVCEHGSAKSVLAAAQFNKLVSERNLNLLAISRGTVPDEEYPPNVLQGLAAGGLKPGDGRPQLLSPDDLSQAARIIAFCDLPPVSENKARIERWSDIPPVSEDYNRASDALEAKIKKLLDDIKVE